MSPQLSTLRDELLQVLLSPAELHQLLDDAGLPVSRIATDLPLEGQLHLALKQAAIHNRLGVLLAHARRRWPEASLPHVDAHLAEHGSPPLPSPPRARLRTAARPWVLLLFVLCWAAGALLLNREFLGLYSVAYALGGILIRTFLPGLVERWTMVPALSTLLALLLLALALLGPGGVPREAASVPTPSPPSPTPTAAPTSARTPTPRPPSPRVPQGTVAAVSPPKAVEFTVERVEGRVAILAGPPVEEATDLALSPASRAGRAFSFEPECRIGTPGPGPHRCQRTDPGAANALRPGDRMTPSLNP